MVARALSLLALSFLVSTPAWSLATRTWVSGFGLDSNPCSYTAPCRTFSGALAKTDPGGIISVKDNATYSPVTINKSITIDGGGTYASVRHFGLDGITVNITSNDASGNVVVLRGLSIDSNGSGYGIVNTSSVTTHLHIEDCTLTRAGAGVGIFVTGQGSTVKMKNVDIRKMSAYGVVVSPPAGTPLKLTMTGVKVNHTGTYGLRILSNTNAMVVDSAFNGNDHGVSVESTSVHLNLTRTIVSQNSVNGLRHLVAGITTIIDRCSIFGNGTGISNTGSTVVGFNNNSIANNLQDVTGNAVQSLLQQ